MFVLEVLPLAAGAPPVLSYRHGENLPPGTLLSMPLRKKMVRGIVLGSVPVQDAKASLKTAGFSLRGGTFKIAGRIPDALVETARSVALEYATGLGGVLSALFGEYLSRSLPELSPGAGFSEEALEESYDVRVARYETMMKAGRGTLIVCPTLAEAMRLKERFSAHAPLLLSGEEKGAKRTALIEKALSSTGLVLATPAFAFVPMPNLGLVIAERAGAGSYLREKRPYLDLRRALRAYARARGIPLVLGDLPLPLALRSTPAAPVAASVSGTISVLDVRTKEEDEKKSFRAVPEALMERIRATSSAGGRVAVLAVRKGYAPAVVCRDCGTLMQDEHGRALTFAKAGGKPVLRSADGKTVKDADMLCPVCGSWNLLPLGIGVERVVEELADAGEKVVAFEPGALRSKRALASLRTRAAQPGSVLVGSESMLPFLDPEDPLEAGIVASADSLLALPFWAARERLVRLGLALRERARHVSIATRAPEDLAFRAIQNPADAAFWKEEAQLRTHFSYPPAGRLIVFHAEASRAKLEESFALVRRAMQDVALTRLPDKAVSPTRFRLSLVAKVPAADWPNASLSERIAALPPAIEVRIDPESLWS